MLSSKLLLPFNEATRARLFLFFHTRNCAPVMCKQAGPFQAVLSLLLSPEGAGDGEGDDAAQSTYK